MAHVLDAKDLHRVMDALPAEMGGPGLRIGIHGTAAISDPAHDRRGSARRYACCKRLITRIILMFEVRPSRRDPPPRQPCIMRLVMRADFRGVPGLLHTEQSITR